MSQDELVLIGATIDAQADLGTPPPAALYFDVGWQQHQTAMLYAGAEVTLIVRPERFPRLGVAGSVWAKVRWREGAFLRVPLGERRAGCAAGCFVLPAEAQGLEVQLWTQSPDGEVEQDCSLEGSYRFATHAWKPSVVRFGAEGAVQLDRPVQAGGVLVVDYDIARLPHFRGRDHYGLEAWGVKAHLRFNDGRCLKQSLVRRQGAASGPTVLTGARAVFPIPQDVCSLELWFENWQSELGDHAVQSHLGWDSRQGKNYQFPVELGLGPRPWLAWVGGLDFSVQTEEQTIHRGDINPLYGFASLTDKRIHTVVEVRVWLAGVTDRAYGSVRTAEQAAAQHIRGELMCSGAEGAEQIALDLAFRRQQGLCFVFGLELGQAGQTLSRYVLGNAQSFSYSIRFSTSQSSLWLEENEVSGRQLVWGKRWDGAVLGGLGVEGPGAIGWAGNWHWRPGLGAVEAPADDLLRCSAPQAAELLLSAEVWVPGLTDVLEEPEAILAEVQTPLGSRDGQLVGYPLSYEGRRGNNYVYGWRPGRLLACAPGGKHEYRFRFSANGGQSWHMLGAQSPRDAGEMRILWLGPSDQS